MRATSSSSGVSTGPGHTAVTPTPWRAASGRRLCASPTTAYLVIAYGVSNGSPASPASEAISTIAPRCCSRRSGYAACTVFDRAADVHVDAARPVVGGEVLHEPADADAGVGDDDVEPTARGADLRERPTGRVEIGDVEVDVRAPTGEIRPHHLRARAREPVGERRADPARGSGDHHDRAVQLQPHGPSMRRRSGIAPSLHLRRRTPVRITDADGEPACETRRRWRS